jgi:hypothetical protein
VFCNGRGGHGGAHPHERRLIGSGNNEHGPRESFRTKRAFDEFADLAPALSNEADYRQVRIGIPRHDADERALAHAGPAKDADTLSATHGEQSIHGSDSCSQGALNRLAIERRMQRACNSQFHRLAGNVPSVHRNTRAVEDLSDHAVTYLDFGARAQGLDGIAKADAFGRLQGHRQDARSSKSDHLGEVPCPESIFDLAAFSH